MSGKTVQLSYALHPPSEVSQPIAGPSSQPVPSSSTLTFSIPPATINTPQPLSVASLDSDTARYYAALTASVRELQVALNENLTYWKDAVGDLEKSKEDLGKVAYGKGRATVMSLAVNGEWREDQAQQQKQSQKQGKAKGAPIDESSSEESEDE